jgi:hypothetical protein
MEEEEEAALKGNSSPFQCGRLFLIEILKVFNKILFLVLPLL